MEATIVHWGFIGDNGKWKLLKMNPEPSATQRVAAQAWLGLSVRNSSQGVGLVVPLK